MNFLYIGNFPNGKVRSGEESISRALERAGHKVYPFHFRQFDADAKLLAFNSAFGVNLPTIDYVMVSKAEKRLISVDTIKKVLEGRKSATWIFDGFEHWRIVKKWAFLTDLFITTMSGEVSLYHEAGLKNVVSIQIGCDLETDYVLYHQNKKMYDIVFIGNDDLGRRKGILTEVDKAFPGKLSMFGAAKKVGNYGSFYKGEMFGEQSKKIIASSKIVLGLNHYAEDVAEGIWSNRLYKTMAAGSFLLHEKVKGMDFVFTNQEHLVYWQGTKNLIDLIKYYLVHEEKREKIAKQGQEYVLNYQSYDNRIKDLLDLINYQNTIITSLQKKYRGTNLFWGSEWSRDIRLKILTTIAPLENQTILDVGCGYGDFYPLLRQKNIKHYIGIDISKDCIEEAKKKYPEGEFYLADILGFKGKFDYILGSGLFGVKVEGWFEFAVKILKKMFKLAQKGVGVNFIIKHSNLIEDGLSYSTTLKEIQEVVGQVTSNFKIVSGYKDNDVTVFLFKE